MFDPAFLTAGAVIGLALVVRSQFSEIGKLEERVKEAEFHLHNVQYIATAVAIKTEMTPDEAESLVSKLAAEHRANEDA